MGELLEGRNAIVYGGGGSLGGGVARTFAREGARVFLVGRTRETLEAVAKDVEAASGAADVAVFDALDEQAVDEHVADVVSRTGSVDVSFNLIMRGDVQGIPLVDMTVDDLLRAVVNGLRSNFLTARAAGRRMAEQGSGVILHLNSASGAGAMPGMGSTGPADAATEGPSCGTWLPSSAPGACGSAASGRRGRRQLDQGEACQRRGAEHAGPGDGGRDDRRDGSVAPGSADRRRRRGGGFPRFDRAAGITGTMTNVTSGLVLR